MDEIFNLIESVSEVFSSYSFKCDVLNFRLNRSFTCLVGPACNFIAGRLKAALLFWFYGDFRCGVSF